MVALKGKQKAGLVWSPAPDSAHVSKPSPSSGGGAGSPPTPTATPGSHAQQHGPPLMHWMSVMAEHMSTNTHHPDVPHYMWNGVESKMNVPDQINGGPLQKDDGRMDSHAHGGHASLGGSGSLYGPRSSSSGSSTPTTAATTPSGMSGNKMGASSQSNGTGRKYQCKMCPQMFGSKADLQLHTQMHMREAKPYKCTQCTKAFANSSYLSQHTRIHLGIKPYRCEICQRKFTQLSHLQQHIRTHTGDKPYKCRHPGCSKAFSQLSNLQSHSRCHQTDKPYKCNSCYKCFTDESALLEHIPKHKESKHLKTHICQYCGKSYTQETYLAKHMQKHAERAEKRSSAAAAAAAAAALRIDTSYWSKNADVTGSGNLDHMHSHVQEPGCNLAGIPDDLPRHGHHNHGHLGAQVGYDVTKTGSVSAFTPLQGGMLPLGTGQLGMASAGSSSSRSYFPYDPLGFSKGHHPQMGVSMTTMEMKSANTFPNQLISLHPIKNYAHHTNLGIGATCGDPFGLAKDKNQ